MEPVKMPTAAGRVEVFTTTPVRLVRFGRSPAGRYAEVELADGKITRLYVGTVLNVGARMHHEIGG